MTETAIHPEARAAWAKQLRRLRRALVPHRPKAFRDSLNRWLLMGTVIGIVSGVGAIIFFFCLKTGTHWLLETLGGYTPPGTLGRAAVSPAPGSPPLGHPAHRRRRRPGFGNLGVLRRAYRQRPWH